ncbi:hypothetical protein TNCV_2109481 [Trichonephila clavipes]|nr:hypothetical protein TNCV_2109481 [Trichonephila clavipes]
MCHLHIIDGTLNVIKYIDTILEPKLLPSTRDLFTTKARIAVPLTGNCGEDNLPDSKFVLTENGRGVSDFRLTLYKRSDDSHLRDEQQLVLDSGLSATTYKTLTSRLGLRTALRRPASCLVTWNERVSRS